MAAPVVVVVFGLAAWLEASVVVMSRAAQESRRVGSIRGLARTMQESHFVPEVIDSRLHELGKTLF